MEIRQMTYGEESFRARLILAVKKMVGMVKPVQSLGVTH